MVAGASEDYLAGGTFNLSDFRLHDVLPVDLIIGSQRYDSIYNETKYYLEGFRTQLKDRGAFERLNAEDCRRDYSTQYVSARGNLLLVQEMAASNAAYRIISHPLLYPSYMWACPWNSARPCNPYSKTEVPNIESWKPYGNTVLYCWSRKVEENCKVGFSLYFAITVMICNLIKVIAMFLTWKTHRQKALITLGDALESFLDKEDNTTRGLCTYSADQIKLLWNRIDDQSNLVAELTTPQERLIYGRESKQWHPKLWYWGRSATWKRWASCYAL